MTTEVEQDMVLREAVETDLAQMLPVLQSAFDQWPPFEVAAGAEAHLRWKMAPPQDVPATTIVGCLNDRVVTVATRWAAHARLGGTACIVNNSADLAIPPEHQGRGFGRALADYSEQLSASQSELGLSTRSKSAKVPKMFGATGEAAPHLARQQVRVWVRTGDASAFAATHWRGGGLRHLGRTAGRALAQTRRTAEMSTGIEVREIETFDERVDNLWNEVAPQFDYALERTAPYLNWRYHAPGAGLAYVLGAFEGDALRGYAVFKRAADWANVLDLVTAPGQPAIAVELLEAGWAAMRESGARGLSCWLAPAHHAEPALEAAGFLDDGEGARVTLRRRRDFAPFEVLRLPQAKLHITLGDFDFV
jgi:hypothetical protein